MKIKNKIGCLDKKAINYDSTSDIACKNCCVSEKGQKTLQNLIERISPKNLKSLQSYSSYALGYLDNRPFFNYITQAEKYGLQIGCEGYHEHEFEGKTVYMACENHEPITNQKENTLSCEDYIEGVTENGIVIWSNITELEKQKDCCKKRSKEGYQWDDITRKCYLRKSDNKKIIGNHSVLSFINTVPVWYTQGAANEYANIIECTGTHTHDVNGRTGYMACSDHTTAESQFAPSCFNTETRVDGSLVFTNTNTTNTVMTNQACCQQWIQYSFMWNGEDCQPLENSLTWQCIDGIVTEVLDGSGYYQNFNDAITYCESSSYGELTYDCENNNCEVNPVGDGQYRGPNALTDCLIYCKDCNENPVCCDTMATNCDSKCQTASIHNNCGCDNSYCIYNVGNVQLRGSTNRSGSQLMARVGNPSLPGDTNCDGIVNLDDLFSVLDNWLQTGPNLPGDTNDDNIVNLDDLFSVLDNWLQTGPPCNSRDNTPQGTFTPTIVPNGCSDLCLTFDFQSIITQFDLNTNLNGTGIWRDFIDIQVPNYWSNVDPSSGVYNIFTLPDSNGFIQLYDSNNTNVGVASHQQSGIPSNFTYTLHWFDSGVLTEIVDPTTDTTVLPPNSYLIKIIDNNAINVDTGLPCEYSYNFAINNSNHFIMNTSIGGSLCAIWGCTDAAAANYEPTANAENNSCSYVFSQSVPGCTDPLACNYDSLATFDNGSCTYNCYGCTDPVALNFNTNATIPCNGNYGNYCDTPGPSNCCCEYHLMVYGCTDPYAQNYDPSADTDDGSCDYTIVGCTNPLANNFDPGATVDNGTCEIPGCTDDGTDLAFPGRPNGFLGTASNYDPNATINDDSCVYVDCVYGCTDPTSTNYDPDATCDDDSCYGGCCGVQDGIKGQEYVITGFTDSKLSDILWPGYSNASSVSEATTNPAMTDKYGVNPYYPLIKRVPSLGMNDGWTVINENLFTAYTINNIHYWDYSTIPTPSPIGENVITRFAIQMTNCCPGCLYPDIKEEWTLGHVFPPQIENNVFIDRGQISIFEDYYRITEVDRLEDFDLYQGGFFNIIS